MAHLMETKQPYMLTVAASAAAIASINDAAYLAENVARLRDERQRFVRRP